MVTNTVIRNCLYCSKEFTARLIPCHIKAGRGKYCSPQCSGKHNGKLSDSTRNEIIQLAKETEISATDLAKQFNVSPAVTIKILRNNNLNRSTANRGCKNGMYGKTHSLSAIEKIKAANQRQFSKPGAREQHAKLTCEQIKNGKTGKSFNKLEQLIAKLLTAKQIEFTQQFIVGTYIFDFYIPLSNTLIEAQGTFWHSDPRFYSNDKLSIIQKQNRSNDINKATFAIKHGYNIRYIWEYDVTTKNEI